VHLVQYGRRRSHLEGKGTNPSDCVIFGYACEFGFLSLALGRAIFDIDVGTGSTPFYSRRVHGRMILLQRCHGVELKEAAIVAGDTGKKLELKPVDSSRLGLGKLLHLYPTTVTATETSMCQNVITRPQSWQHCIVMKCNLIRQHTNFDTPLHGQTNTINHMSSGEGLCSTGVW
jgi:hypothetical protein